GRAALPRAHLRATDRPWRSLPADLEAPRRAARRAGGRDRERMKGLEPSTFAMARRRSSQLSYIRSVTSIAQAVMARSRRPAPAGAPTEVPLEHHRRHPRKA